MQHDSDDEIGAHVRAFYSDVSVPVADMALLRRSRTVRLLKQRVTFFVLSAVVASAGIATAAPDIRTAAATSIAHALEVEFHRPVEHASATTIGLETIPRRASFSFTPICGLPRMASLVAIREMGSEHDWFDLIYTIQGRKGDATFSVTANRHIHRAVTSIANVGDITAPPMPTHFISWRMATENVSAIIRGDALTSAELADVRKETERGATKHCK